VHRRRSLLEALHAGPATHGARAEISSEAIDLPGLLAEFHIDHPAVEITLSVANTDVLVDGLRGGRLDLAFIGSARRPRRVGYNTFATHKGMFPCFFGGRVWRLSLSMRRARAT
jgi:DNA-binding transcriptional LysR family regulator